MVTSRNFGTKPKPKIVSRSLGTGAACADLPEPGSRGEVQLLRLRASPVPLQGVGPDPVGEILCYQWVIDTKPAWCEVGEDRGAGGG